MADYIVPLKDKVRKAEGLELGQQVAIRLDSRSVKGHAGVIRPVCSTHNF